jgi:hypothetical protein
MVSELLLPSDRAFPIDLVAVLLAHLLKKNVRLHILSKHGKGISELNITYDSSHEQNFLKLYI